MRLPLRLVAAQTGSDDGGDDIYTQILRRFSPQLLLSLFASILAASVLLPASAHALRSSIDGQHPVDAFALSLDGGMLGISHTEKRSRSPWASASGHAFLGAAQERADVLSSGTLNGSDASMTACSRTCYWSEAVM